MVAVAVRKQRASCARARCAGQAAPCSRARSLRDKLLIPQRFVGLLSQRVQRGGDVRRQRLGAVRLEHLQRGRRRVLDWPEQEKIEPIGK
jgi:hypothetical protein